MPLFYTNTASYINPATDANLEEFPQSCKTTSSITVACGFFRQFHTATGTATGIEGQDLFLRDGMGRIST